MGLASYAQYSSSPNLGTHQSHQSQQYQNQNDGGRWVIEFTSFSDLLSCF